MGAICFGYRQQLAHGHVSYLGSAGDPENRQRAWRLRKGISRDRKDSGGFGSRLGCHWLSLAITCSQTERPWTKANLRGCPRTPANGFEDREAGVRLRPPVAPSIESAGDQSAVVGSGSY
jgi:hypothetical protein